MRPYSFDNELPALKSPLVETADEPIQYMRPPASAVSISLGRSRRFWIICCYN